MNELVVIVEGETELTFVRDQLAAHLALHGTIVWAVLPGKHRRHGGVKRWASAKQDIIRTLLGRRLCTTMFDFYGLPNDWPGRQRSRVLPWDQRASFVEEHIHKDITQSMGDSFNSRCFIPYVQLHEFEALAFADVKALASVIHPISDWPPEKLVQSLTEVLDEAGHPEAINDSYETCPSRRIMDIVPAYRKRAHGPVVTQRIGLELLRQQCDHFAQWITQLESIGD